MKSILAISAPIIAFTGCVSTMTKSAVIGRYRNVDYRPVMGYWLRIMEDGRFESGPIGSVMGGGDRGTWTLSGREIVLKSDTNGESVAHVTKKDCTLMLHWRDIDYVRTRNRDETIEHPHTRTEVPNQAPLRMPVSVTPAADAPVAPPPGIAGL